jgi:uncharacterized protein YegP (UPF0339 family)
MSYYTLFKGGNGKFYWNLRAPNHEIICQSEGYDSKQGASNGIAANQRYASTTTAYDKTSAVA